MTDSDIPVFRAQLRYESVDDFIEGYSQFVLPGKMFVPLDESQLKPVDSRVRFEFTLADGTRALVGEGVVRQVRGPDQGGGPTGLVVKYTHLSRRSKQLIGQIVDFKRAQARAGGETSSAAEVAQHQDSESDPEATVQKVEEPESPAGDQPSEPRTPETDAPTHQDIEPPTIDEDPRAAERARAEAEADEELEELPPETIDESEGGFDEQQTAEGEDYAFDEPHEGEDVDLGDRDSTPYDDFDDLGEVSDAYGKEPKQVGETEGGLQIMAFDEVDEEGAEEFAEFAHGSDEEDVDQMFDDVFKGGGGGDGDGLFGDDGDDMFGGGGDAADGDMFGGGDGSGDDMFEEAGAEMEADGDMFDGGSEATVDDGAGGSDEQPPEPAADAESGAGDEISSAIDDEFDSGHPDDSGTAALNADSFSETIDESAGEHADDHPPTPEHSPSSEVEERPDHTPPPEQSPSSEADEGPPTDVLSDPPSSPEPDDASEQVGPAESSPEDSGYTGFSASGSSDDLDQALDSLEEESEEEKDLSLSISGGQDEVEKPDEAPADDSLEALVEDAQKDIERRNKREEDEKDALDEVLGEDMPPPPSDDTEFDASESSRPSFNTSGGPEEPESQNDEDASPDESNDEDDSSGGGFISSMFGSD